MDEGGRGKGARPSVTQTASTAGMQCLGSAGLRDPLVNAQKRGGGGVTLVGPGQKVNRRGGKVKKRDFIFKSQYRMSIGDVKHL